MTNFIYHHNDLDGYFSREIVKKFIKTEFKEEAVCREINYGMPFDDHDVDHEEDRVFVVDFCIQPTKQMLKLIEETEKNLTWIDHHKTSVELIEENPWIPEKCNVVVESGKKAACELCWEYLFPNEQTPVNVQLISQYDVWNHDGPFDWLDYVEPFKLFMETREITEKELEKLSNEELHSLIFIGKCIREHSRKIDKSIMLENSHELRLRVPGTKKEYYTIVLNSAKRGSRQFTSTYPPLKFDLMLSYRNTKGNYWTIGLYSENKKVDCSDIAKRIGAAGKFGPGGGHKGAAGCQVDTETLVKILKL